VPLLKRVLELNPLSAPPNPPHTPRTPHTCRAGRGGQQVPLAALVGGAVLLVARRAQHARPCGSGEGGVWGPCQ
jgi:hypothetical protein